MNDNNARLGLHVGARILTYDGQLLVVTAMGRYGVTVETSTGVVREIAYTDLAGTQVGDGVAQAVMAALEPRWSGLPERVRQDALTKLEVVHEILTGYRWGHPRLAQAGEPYLPFGDSEVSIAERCGRMARQLSYEREANRQIVRRINDGELARTTVGKRTVQKWVESWSKEGLWGLVNKQATRVRRSWDRIPLVVREIADERFEARNGDISKVNITTIDTEVRIELKKRDLSDLNIPQRLFQEYLSEKQHELGGNTRAHRSRRLRRKASGHTSYPAMHPAHLAMDATRIDVLVWDEMAECPRSVEVLTLISVATRVIVALRVTPRSGNALEAGLMLYDTMRPMSMFVEGTTVDDWRWCGVPESLDLSGVPVHRSPRRIIEPGQTLQGVHYKPAIRPASIRCDHGSVFLSEHFIGLLRDFGIDLMLSRGSKPTDNPHVERWHETLQRAVQGLPGYKGRNVAERGRLVGKDGTKLMTASELEQHLRRFVALDYHRSPHEGLVLPGAPKLKLTPLAMWDAMMAVTGRVHVPQRPDLIYQFLPIRWLTIGHAGVEYKNLAYDAPVLEDFRNVRPGTFKADSRKAPFHYDPRDMSRIWFRHPETNRIHEIGWKADYEYDLPLWEAMVDDARENVRKAAGKGALNRHTVRKELIAVFGTLTAADASPETRNKMYAARERWEQARRDHEEAAHFASLDHTLAPRHRQHGPASSIPAFDVNELFNEEWPDYGTAQ